MQGFKSVIFDLDGTLLDTSEGIIEGIEYAIKQLCLPALSYNDLKAFVGPPLQRSFVDKCGCGEKEAQKATEIFREYYGRYSILKCRPYDKIYSICKSLQKQGIKMAVATNKREVFARQILTEFGFDPYLDVIHGSDSEGKLKKNDIIQKCLIELNVIPEETVLIGDTNYDAEAAEKTGCKFIAALWGFGFSKNEDVKNQSIGNAFEPLDVLKYLCIT